MEATEMRIIQSPFLLEMSVAWEPCYIGELDFQPTGKMCRQACLRVRRRPCGHHGHCQLGAWSWQTHW